MDTGYVAAVELNKKHEAGGSLLQDSIQIVKILHQLL